MVNRGNIEIVKLLIEKGIDVNDVDRDGETALMYASYKKNKEMMELLIKNGAKSNK